MLKIGDKVEITVGEYKGQIGIYKGKKNNSEWLEIKLKNNEILLVNYDELAILKKE
jgi:transcription elongation factor